MMRSTTIGVRALLGALLLVVLGASTAAASDDYTLPFYDPSVQLSYGMDRDLRLNVQLDWTGHRWWDGVPHPGRVYDNHSGLDYPMALHSEVAASGDGTVVVLVGGFGTQQFGDFGNFVRVRHAGGKQTLYYHLASAASGGIVVDKGQSVLAGQLIAHSGCSGLCFGAHLHFELLVEQGKNLVSSDPMFGRAWTTWPGRVPFLASYVRESNAGTEVVRRGQTITHWVEFRNSGGRTWVPNVFPGRIALATWDPPAHASAFRAADWVTSWRPTHVDQASVKPDGIGRFTFGIRGGPPAGSYRETFNLLAHALHWFDHAAIGNFYVPIIVSNLLE